MVTSSQRCRNNHDSHPHTPWTTKPARLQATTATMTTSRTGWVLTRRYSEVILLRRVHELEHHQVVTRCSSRSMHIACSSTVYPYTADPHSPRHSPDGTKWTREWSSAALLHGANKGGWNPVAEVRGHLLLGLALVHILLRRLLFIIPPPALLVSRRSLLPSQVRPYSESSASHSGMSSLVLPQQVH